MDTRLVRRENGGGGVGVDGMTAEELVVEVDSYDVLHHVDHVDLAGVVDAKAAADAAAKESLILSIRHGKVQRKLAKELGKQSSTTSS